MKKGVVLLITIFFITAISLLVLKNLDESDKYLDSENYIANNTQVLIAIKNTQKEISKLLLKYQEDVDNVLDDEFFESSIPIDIEELHIKFNIKKSQRVDVNSILEEESTTLKNLFYKYDIYDYDEFVESYNNKKLQIGFSKVSSTKQLDDIIFDFIRRVEKNKIEEIREYLGFLSITKLYELVIESDYIGSNAKAYYLLDEEGKVQYFDISFD